MPLPHFGGKSLLLCDICWKNDIYIRGIRYQGKNYCEKHLKKIQRLEKLKKIDESK